uniref:TRAF-type domain-containing protein n=1 Tax=Aegilops tauschii subsp. strangulata TaxID=200361 RepID=A0A453AUR9_AEGTS
RKHMDQHYDDNHAPVNCPRCEQTVEHELWDLHKRLQCPQRMLACQYCKFELPAADIFEHQDVCGNRTKYCQPCNKDIRLREWIGHELLLHSKTNAAAESSRIHAGKRRGWLSQASTPSFWFKSQATVPHNCNNRTCCTDWIHSVPKKDWKFRSLVKL